MDEKMLAELERVRGDLTQLLPMLPKHRIRELKSLLLKHFEKTYNTKSKPPRYGTLNKGFTDEELERFLACVSNPKFHLLFEYQVRLGLRIGEAVRIRASDINKSTRELTIFTLKARVLNTLIIPLELFNETLAWMQANEKRIESNQGYIFYPDHERSHSKRSEPYLELNYVRRVFRSYIRLAWSKCMGRARSEMARNREPFSG